MLEHHRQRIGGKGEFLLKMDLQDFSERDYYSLDDFPLTRHAAVSLHEVLLATEDGQAHE